MSYESNENGCAVLGPWGGQNGIRWDDGIYNNVRQIVIYYGAAIESIQIEYDTLGTPVLSDKHGGTGGIKTNKVKLDVPNEYLVSINGYYGSIMENGPVLVRSLTFVSNKKKYGPFGIQQGTYFSSPVSSEIVVGFYGRSSWYLDSIGVYLKPMSQRNPTSNLSRIPEPQRNKKQDDNKVSPYYSKVGEQMIGSSGYGGGMFDDGKPMSQRNLTSNLSRIPEPQRNKKQDDNKVSPYYSKVGEQMIGSGGYGGGMFDDGVYTSVREVHLTRYLSPYRNPFTMNYVTSPIYSLDRGNPGIAVNEEASTYMLGPWGGEGGKPWNDGEFSGIKKIYLTKGEAIYCIQIEYDRNGKSILSFRHGGGSEGNSQTINFDYPHEILTGICGYHDSFTGDARKSVVKSLTFITNKGKYGPYGEETGTFFSSCNSEGKIIGFHGRSGCYLNSIGVHLQQWSNDPQLQLFGQLSNRGGPIKFNMGKFF